MRARYIVLSLYKNAPISSHLRIILVQIPIKRFALVANMTLHPGFTFAEDAFTDPSKTKHSIINDRYDSKRTESMFTQTTNYKLLQIIKVSNYKISSSTLNC